MKIDNNSIVTPLPTDELIEAFENDSRVELVMVLQYCYFQFS